MRRRADDRGTVTAYAVVLATALVLCIGLVVDGGRLVDARIEASDLADGAARAGAQQLAAVRTGRTVLDAARARRAAAAFLATAGAAGDVEVTPSRVTVTVRLTRTPTLLGLAGVGARTVSATRSAEPVVG